MEKLLELQRIDKEGLVQIIRTLLKEEFKELAQNLKIKESDQLLTRKEAAEFLRISKTKLWELDRKQILPAKRLVGTVLYLKSDLINFFKQSA